MSDCGCGMGDECQDDDLPRTLPVNRSSKATCGKQLTGEHGRSGRCGLMLPCPVHDDLPVTIRDLYGIDPDFTGDLTAVEHVRLLRGRGWPDDFGPPLFPPPAPSDTPQERPTA